MGYPDLLYTSFLAADERSESKALLSVRQQTPSKTPIAPPTDRQKRFYTRDSVPSDCKRVGFSYTRCTEDGAAAGPANVLSTLYINNDDDNNDNHELARAKASAIPYQHSTTNLPLHDAMPAIDICANSTGMLHLTCGSPSVAIRFFIVVSILLVLLSIAVWLTIRSAKKLQDEERAIGMRPLRDRYHSVSKPRLKKKVRCTSRPNKMVQDSEERYANNFLKSYSVYSETFVGGWRAAIIREKNDNFAKLPVKELPRGADAPTSLTTVADMLDYYP